MIRYIKVIFYMIISASILLSCTGSSNKVEATNRLTNNNILIASVFKQNPKEYHVWTRSEITSNKEAQDLKIQLALLNHATIYFYNDSTLDDGHYYASYSDILSKNPLQSFKMSKGGDVYIEAGDTITFISAQGVNYDLLTNRQLCKNDVGLLKRALNYIKAYDAKTVFLYLANNYGENFYASYNGVTIHNKATAKEVITNIISELNEEINIESIGNVMTFLSKIDRSKELLADCSDESLKSKLSSSLSTFQKLYYPKARNIYYQNAKKELWEKNIEVSLSGKDITFIGYTFIDNKVKKETYNEIRNELSKLRFKTVGFKAFDDDNKTYWNLNTSSDSEI